MYKYGITEFECGVCPECLAKRARRWALRCVAESYYNKGCMVTLTYDTYVRDDKGNILKDKYGVPLENPADTRPLSKRDCQLFLKRLRKHFKDSKIKYLLTAERGSRTNRSHYHALLFGVEFKDRIFYKRSKRGNIIYTSPTLQKIWNNGICTIDSVNLNGKTARYCTKYCAKDGRTDDSFSLFSRGIGDRWLNEKFNGISYFIDGREYPIPKQIWQRYIMQYYANNIVFKNSRANYKYVSFNSYKQKLLKDLTGISFGSVVDNYDIPFMPYYKKHVKPRNSFAAFRDSNPLYKRYISYWKAKADNYKRTLPNVLTRIQRLPNAKYFAYKQACLKFFNFAERLDYERDGLTCRSGFVLTPPRKKSNVYKYMESHLPCAPCHFTANDTKYRRIFVVGCRHHRKIVYLRPIEEVCRVKNKYFVKKIE